MSNSNQITDLKVIVFLLKDEAYGVPVDQVLSIEKLEKITRVPGTPSFIKGVINLRGVITPIIDLRNRFGFVDDSNTDNTRIIVVKVDEIEVGLIVDSANDVIDISSDQIEATPEIVNNVKADYIRGVAKLESQLLILLNLDKVLNNQEINDIKTIEV